MKLIKVLFQFSFLIIFSTQISAQDPLIGGIIDRVNLDSLVKHVRILSGEDSLHLSDTTVLIKNRSYGNTGNILAADYLENKLKKYGAETQIVEFRENGQNVIGVKPGTLYPDEYYIICAHYDGVVDYGADDNASGCAAILETARILEPYQFDRTIVYAFWDEEEIGLYGSEDYASGASENSINIKAVVNLDMIAWDEDNDRLCDIYLKEIGNTNSLAAFIDETAKEFDLELKPNFIVPELESSDHASFWKYGFTATLFGETFYGDDFNPYWHKPEDRIGEFNLGYFHELSRLAAGVIAKLATIGLNTATSVIENKLETNYILNQNYPNPFNPSTTISYILAETTQVSLKVYDVLGKEVTTLVDEEKVSGQYEVNFTDTNLSSGIYYYTLKTDGNVLTRKMLLIK